ncbi:MAG: peptidase [Verrucomicrobiaceae bacterium]|nr:MAG: peptidase [Verrucomicrobiaceae bacterium]
MKYLIPVIVAACSAGETHAVSLISLNFSGSMSAIEQQTFIDAADFWNSVITGYDLFTDDQGFPKPHSLEITASIPYIDGPGGVLGSAGWTDYAYYDNDPLTPNPTIALFYATEGIMEFDSADVAAMVGNNTFYSVVLHEMAHVLGIGTLWTGNNNVNGTTYQLYDNGSGQYTGPNALAAWQSEFNQPGATFVPVELGGGPGTANGHWNENDSGIGLTGFTSNISNMDFANELMTGWASSTFFLSTVTLGGLDDIGYVVDYSKAGVINHTVVPEASATLICLLGAGLVGRRRR